MVSIRRHQFINNLWTSLRLSISRPHDFSGTLYRVDLTHTIKHSHLLEETQGPFRITFLQPRLIEISMSLTLVKKK